MEDDGALLLLAGFILGIALIITGLTLSEVAQLENEAVREQDSSFIAEYRSVRGKVTVALQDSVTSTTSAAVFTQTFENVRVNFEQLESTRGYNLVMILAGGSETNLCTQANALGPRSECVSYTTTDATCAAAPQLRYTSATDVGAECYDGVEDGIVMADNVVQGAVLYVYLDDAAQSLEETFYVDLNG